LLAGAFDPSPARRNACHCGRHGLRRWLAFGFDDVDRMAKELASRPQPKSGFVLPKALKDLSYDQTRDIRFDPDHACGGPTSCGSRSSSSIWVGCTSTSRSACTRSSARRCARSSSTRQLQLRRQQARSRRQLQKLGFAGFRIHYPLNTPRYKDELAVFLGASYFRVLGKGQRYGASARGLALDTAERNGEEFPRFEQFWIEKPARGATQLVCTRCSIPARDRRLSLRAEAGATRRWPRCSRACTSARRSARSESRR
jgi:periplasmic glucans biosynthesis protein